MPLRDNNISAQVHYIPVYLQLYYKKLGWKKGDLPIVEAYYKKCLSLPIYPLITDEQQDFFIEKVEEISE